MSTRRVYVSHPGAGLARSTLPIVCEIDDGEIVRSLPYYVPDDVRLYEIRTSRGSFRRSRKEVQMPLAYAWKRRVHASTRVRYPLLREDWAPGAPNAASRGSSGFKRIGWDQAIDIVVGELERVRTQFGSMEPVLVQADGHGQSGYLHSLHFWGHYLFDMARENLGWGWWTQQVRNPDSWEGYYWGAKHVWGFDATLGEPYQDAVWDDVLEHAEVVIFSGNDPEATGFGMSGSIALDMPKWLKQAGIKIVAIAPDLNYAAAVHADTWIPVRPNTDGALYLALAHTWLAESSYDADYVATHTVGFDEFRDYVTGRRDGTPKDAAWAEGITGVPARTIRALAREWASKRTTLSVYFGGPKVRGTHSHAAARFEAYAMAMQGIGRPGRQFLRTGAPSFYKNALAQVPRYPAVDRTGIALNPLIEYAIGKGPMSPVFVPRTLAAEAILHPPIEWRGTTAALAATKDQFVKYKFPPTHDHPGIRVVWNENGSQPGSWGYGWKWLDALRSETVDFVVGIHPWFENDLPYSDLVLPAQTMYEHEDIISAQRSDILAMFYQDQAIDPVGESRSDYDIHRLIGERLGLASAFPPADDWLRSAYEGTLAATELGISWDEFKERKEVVYDCPSWTEWVDIKARHGFGPHDGGLHPFAASATGLETASGKIEFVSGWITDGDGDNAERPPLAVWLAHDEQRTSPRAAAYPLTVVSNHPRFRFHVQGDDVDWIRELAKVPGADGYLYEPCWIHPDDAALRGIADGDVLRLYNDRGAVLFGAIVTQRVIPGAVCVAHGAKLDRAWWDGAAVDRGGNINLIAPSSSGKYQRGDEIRVPEMNISAFLVEAERIDVEAITSEPAPARNLGPDMADRDRAGAPR